MIDQFTRWPVAVALPNRASAVIAKAILDNWIAVHSAPEKIVSDKGRELISKGIKELYKRLGIARANTGGYNPTGNACIERFHRYLAAALTILYDKTTPNWDRFISPVLFAYRVSANDATGYSPFYLQTGRGPWHGTPTFSRGRGERRRRVCGHYHQESAKGICTREVATAEGSG
jgi:transposase InsO family protein